MKTMRKLLAMVLALAMAAGSVGTVLAEDPVEYGDLDSLYVNAQPAEDETKTDLTIEAMKDGLLVEPTTAVMEEAAVEAGDITNDEPEKDEALVINTTDTQVTVETGDVTQNNEDGRAIAVYATGDDAAVAVDTGAVTSAGEGVAVMSNGGDVDVTVESIEAAGEGVSIRTFHMEEGLNNEQDISVEEFSKFLEDAGEEAELYNERAYDDVKIVQYRLKDSYTVYLCRYDLEDHEYQPIYACVYELDHNDGTVDVTVEKDIEVSGQGSAYEWSNETSATGILVSVDIADNEDTVTVHGNVTVKAENEDDDNEVEAQAVSATAGEVNSSIEVTVDGDAAATAETDGDMYGYAFATAVSANADMPGSSVAVTVGGDATATANSTADTFARAGATAVQASSAGKDSLTEVHVKGDAVAEASTPYDANATAISAASGENDYSENEYGHTVVTVDGKAVATAEDGSQTRETAVDAYAYGENSVTEVTVGKGAEGTVSVDAREGGTVEVTIKDGGITAENRAIEIRNGVSEYDDEREERDGGTVTVNVTGDIQSDNAYNVISANANGEKAETTLNVTGNITGKGESSLTVIDIDVAELGTVNATIEGEEITATVTGAVDGEREATGVRIMNGGGSIDAQITANISATGAEINTGLTVGSEATDIVYSIPEGAEPADLDLDNMIILEGVGEGIKIDGVLYPVICVEENVQGGDIYEYVVMDGEYYPYDAEGVFKKGNTNVTVSGDVQGDQYGLNLLVAKEQTATVIVDGTLSGGTAAVVLNNADSVIGENVDLVAWQLKTDSDDADAPLIADPEWDDDKEDLVYTANEEAEKAVRYIVKVMENWAGVLGFDNITTASGNVEVGEDKYHTAVQDEKVKLKFTLADNEVLEGIYYDEETLVDAEEGEDGSFLVKMLRGGGMKLGLKTHKHTMTAFAAVEPTCDKEGNSAYWYCSECKKYFSDANGKNEIKEGSWILPATGHKLKAVAAVEPTCDKEGNIAYWYCEECGKYFADAEGKTEIKQEDTVLKAKGHKLTEVKEKAATETEDGNIAYWYCEECGKYFSDAEGKHEIKKEDTVIKATGEQKESNDNGEATRQFGFIGQAEYLLKIRDTTHVAEITFQRNGDYELKSPAGNDEGTFELTDGQIVLTSQTGNKLTIEHAEDENLWKFTYFIFIGDLEYEFELTEEDMEILKGAFN